MKQSMLPPAGGNLFQRVKKQRADAESRGIKIINMSIGQPAGPAIAEACMTASNAVRSHEESMHEYQDNGSPGVPDFAKRFVLRHVQSPLSLSVNNDVDYLPIPGIKPMLGVVIQSMGSWAADRQFKSFVHTMTKPGYPTPVDQCQIVRGIEHFHLPMKRENGFLFSQSDILSRFPVGRDLIMLNFPHNPTGIIATRGWLESLCEFCQSKGVRLFNDAAYSVLAYDSDACNLTDVAVDSPNLSWAEAFSSSKAGNNTGWRVGAMVGSQDFIGDIKRIKGNTDSGFVAFAAAGIIDLFENHMDKIDQIRHLYCMRLNLVSKILQERGMRLAVEPKAGFFLLFDSPVRAFGETIPDADRFNELMIEKTGIVGVPFGPYIRYAICATDVMATRAEIESGFDLAQVSY